LFACEHRADDLPPGAGTLDQECDSAATRVVDAIVAEPTRRVPSAFMITLA
jgi:hypothetical protein